ncbi:putative zinc finger protein, partial [Orchesella cincta]
MSAQIYLGAAGEYQVIIPNQGVIQKAKELCAPNNTDTQLMYRHDSQNHQHQNQLLPRQPESVVVSTRGGQYGAQTQSTLTSLKFDCAICHDVFSGQFQFFEHLKGHYEGGAGSQAVASTSYKPTQIQNAAVNSHEVGVRYDLDPAIVVKEEIVVEHQSAPPLYSHTKLSQTAPPLLPSQSNRQTSDANQSSKTTHKLGSSVPNKPRKRKKGGGSPLSCQICMKVFRKVENLQLHTNCCQHIPSHEEILGIGNGSEITQKQPQQLAARDDSPLGQIRITQTERIQISKSPQKKTIGSATKPTPIQDDLKNNDGDDGDPEFHVGFDDDDELDEEQTEMMYLDSNICPSCDEMCESKTDLDEHIRNLHPEVLTIPVENIKGSKKKKNGYGTKKPDVLKCQQCHRVFNHRNSLVYHMRGHTGERPHKCDVCSKRFFATSALKVHLRLHSGEKPFHCKHCGRDFRQWGDLKYHIISIHSDIRQYQCEFCGKDFARNYSLIVHRRIHTGERNYKCEFCTKSFRAASYLQNHRRIHTGEKPHSCSICNKPFRVRSDMKRHMASHSRDIKVAEVSVVNAIPVSITSNPVSVVSSIGASVLQPVPIQPKQTSPNIVASIVNTAGVTTGTISHRVVTQQDAFKTALCVPIPIVSQETSPTTTVITGDTINISLGDGGVHHTAEILQTGVTTLQATVPEGMTIYGEYQDTGSGLEIITTEGSRA